MLHFSYSPSDHEKSCVGRVHKETEIEAMNNWPVRDNHNGVVFCLVSQAPNHHFKAYRRMTLETCRCEAP